MAAERTLVLIKPDAMRRGLAGEILRRFAGEPHNGVCAFLH